MSTGQESPQEFFTRLFTWSGPGQPPAEGDETCPSCGASMVFPNTDRYCCECERNGCCECLGPLILAADPDLDPMCAECVHAGQLLLFPVEGACEVCFMDEHRCPMGTKAA